MHPSRHAPSHPDKPAVIEAETGRIVTYGEMDEFSNRFAQFLRARGLQHGDCIALMLDNIPEYFGFAWGAQRAGLYYVCISTRLTAPEVAYILSDSGAKLFVAATAKAPSPAALDFSGEAYAFGLDLDGYKRIEDELAASPATPLADERAGVDMLYSSGTTGRPKGVRVPLPEDHDIGANNSLLDVARAFGLGAHSTYLTPAPMYHAAPLRWSMAIHRLGGTVVLMGHFDAEETLRAIDRYKVDAGQFVPTHFIRMLKLPEEVRAQYDMSSLKCAIHAAAPCPIPVKEQMIAWWGPIIVEYYAGSEGNGLTLIMSNDWLTHKGSVGRAVTGVLHICDENGDEVPARTEGLIYFESETQFTYHNDPEKTKDSRHPRHDSWSTLGDIGWVDEDGFLYLTDRKSFMIISGGVNIYPQEIENHLVTHPKVADVAVIQPANMADAGDELVAELNAYCREALSGVKVPRQIDFREELPRHPTGKLYKRLLRDEYWAKTDSRIV